MIENYKSWCAILSFRLLGGAYHFQIASQRARKALFTCVVINWIYYTEFVIEHTAPLCELILTWKFRFFLSGRQLLWMHRGIWSLHVYMVLILWFFYKTFHYKVGLKKGNLHFHLTFSGFDLVLVSPAPSMIKILKLG